MATKTANVTARVQPEIKVQAEKVLEQLGIPVSVLIDSLYRQIIMRGEIPYSLSIPAMPSEDKLTQTQFHDIMRNGLTQAKAGRGQDLASAFAKINEQI